MTKPKTISDGTKLPMVPRPSHNHYRWVLVQVDILDLVANSE